MKNVLNLCGFAKLCGFALAAAAMILSAPGGAAELKVEVTGLRNGDGVVRLALYDRAELFPEQGKGLVRIALPARADGVAAVFTDLAPGHYALALFHDEDGDDEFDRGFLGVPREGYGFSNDARPFFGPPSFEAAAVAVDEEGASISVRMVYWGRPPGRSGARAWGPNGALTGAGGGSPRPSLRGSGTRGRPAAVLAAISSTAFFSATKR
jgi:uncharacterized protein (DUF2141 family)